MKTKLLMLFMMIATPLLAIDAQARDRLVLRFHDDQFRGQNTLYLKREIRNQHPRVRVRDLKLESVRLVAKSKLGRGTATLNVGGRSSYAETINGSQYDFDSSDRWTFDRVDLYPSGRRTSGAWQIDLRGNIKVREVVLFVRDNGSYNPRPNPRPNPRRSELIRCESKKYRAKSCGASFYITEANLVTQHSDSSCNRGSSWFIRGGQLEVRSGCRATFKVYGN